MEEKVRLIVGYGNPGKRYVNLSSNIAFLVLEAATKKIPSSWLMRARYMLFLVNTKPPTILVKPRTFENRFDDTAYGLYLFYKTAPEDFYVVYPDENVSFGQYEITKESGVLPEAIAKIEKKIETRDFWKIKIGILGASAEFEETEHAVIKYLGEKLAKELAIS